MSDEELVQLLRDKVKANFPDLSGNSILLIKAADRIELLSTKLWPEGHHADQQTD